MFHGVILTSSSAATNQTSSEIETDSATWGSFQVNWASLTGTLDAVVQVEVSDDQVTWIPKTDATFTISTATGQNSISLNGSLTSAYVRVTYTATGVNGGTVSMYATVKGFS